MIPASVNTGAKLFDSIRAHPTNVPGTCLQYDRLRYGIGPKYGSAAAAWSGATHRHHGDYHPPRGVPVFWTGGSHGYGHIAISAGNGQVWSTDCPTGHVAKVSIGSIHRNWGLTYAGWAEDVNGVRVWEPPPPVSLNAAKVGMAKRRKIANGRLLKRALAAEVGRGFMRLNTDRLGRVARARYARWQRHLNYSGAQADGIPGGESFAALARISHRFTARP